jgi:predicted exporter
LTRSARVVIVAWIALLAACAAIIARTEFTADLSAFLPRSPTPAQQILVEQLRDGVVSRLMLIGIEGGKPDQLAAASRRLAAQLRGNPVFAAVNNGEDAGSEKDRELIWRNRYLLSPAMLPGHFSAAQLHGALEDDLQMLGSPAGPLLRHALPNDPSGELLRVLDQFEGQARPDAQGGVWFAKNGARALLVAQTRAAGFDIDAQERALAIVRHAFAAGQHPNEAGAGLSMVVTGPGVFSVASRAGIKEDATRLSGIAAVLVALLLLGLYRSPRVLLLGLTPVVSGALAGIAAVSLAFGSVHGITLGFGVTLIGEGVDYAIYLFTQIAPGTAPQTTLSRLWPTLRLGVLTSICGFSAMLFSGFPGLAQLGLFSIAGLVVAAGVTRFVLPPLLPAGFTARTATALAPALYGLVRRAPALRWLLAAAALGALGFFAMRGGLDWSNELGSLSPVPARELEIDAQMRRDIGAPDVRYMIIADGADQEAALQAGERIAAILARLMQEGALAGYDTPTSLLPSQATQRARLAVLPAPPQLRENLTQALAGLPFQPGLFEPFLRDAQAAANAPLVTPGSLQGTGLAVKLDSLLIKRGSGWAAMMPLRGVIKSEAIAGALATQPGTVLLDLTHETQAMYQGYRSEVVHNSILGACAIVLLLFLALRSPRRVFDVLAPLAAAVLLTAAVLQAGGKLTIFHLVGLLLVVAVGSNYSLFFDRQRHADAGRERTIVSLLFANISTVIGFGILAFSRVPVLHAIGLTVGIGAVLSLVFAAILASPPREA